MAENTQPGSPTPPPPQPNQNQPPFQRETVTPTGNQPIKKGSLFIGKYAFWKHDPYPLVLVSAMYGDGRVAGVNLHRLTLVDMKNLVAQYCNKMFSYQMIKNQRNIVQAFRTYKRSGFTQVKVMDCKYLLASLGVIQQARNISPNETEKIRQQIQQKLRQQINPRATDMVAKPSGTIPGKSATIPGIPVGQPKAGNN